MRLRQLRTTQSVTFFAPPEVDQSIKDFCRVARNQKLDSSYVVHWLLEQTCLMHESLNGLYVAQGIDFCQRTDAAWRHHDFLINPTHRAELLEVLRQPERQTLEQLYGTASESSVIVASMSARPLQAFADQLALSTNNRGAIQTCFMEEVEQEREVQFRVEQVRQVQRYGTRPYHSRVCIRPFLTSHAPGYLRLSCLSGTGLGSSMRLCTSRRRVSGGDLVYATRARGCSCRRSLGRQSSPGETEMRLTTSW